MVVESLARSGELEVADKVRLNLSWLSDRGGRFFVYKSDAFAEEDSGDSGVSLRLKKKKAINCNNTNT